MQFQSTDATPAGLVVRTSPGVCTLSFWVGGREMIADLDTEQAGIVARALQARSGITQLVGQVREFDVRAQAAEVQHGA